MTYWNPADKETIKKIVTDLQNQYPKFWFITDFSHKHPNIRIIPNSAYIKSMTMEKRKLCSECPITEKSEWLVPQCRNCPFIQNMMKNCKDCNVIDWLKKYIFNES